MLESRILIVDDNDHQHELFRCYAMTSDKVELTHAASLDEALEILNEAKPDIVFLDSRLVPYDDYRQTVPLIRDAGYTGKIIVISADVNEAIFLEAEQYSVESCLDKFAISLTNFDAVIAAHME